MTLGGFALPATTPSCALLATLCYLALPDAALSLQACSAAPLVAHPAFEQGWRAARADQGVNSKTGASEKQTEEPDPREPSFLKLKDWLIEARSAEKKDKDWEAMDSLEKKQEGSCRAAAGGQRGYI